MTDRAIDDAALDRLLKLDRPPTLAPDFAARVVAEAQRPDRPRAVTSVPRRGGRRRWTRRGIFTGIVAINLVLASAVAAAIGGGAISVEKIAHVAHRIIAHIHHATERREPARQPRRQTERVIRPAPLRPLVEPRMVAPSRFSRQPLHFAHATGRREQGHPPSAGMRAQRLHRWQRAMAHGRAHPQRQHWAGMHPTRHDHAHVRPAQLNPGTAGAGPRWRDRGFDGWRGGDERGWRAPFRGREFGPGWRDRRGGGWRWRGGGRRGRRF